MLLLTVLAALELLAVLLLQGQLSLQLGDASLGHLPAQLLVLLNQHSTLGHQFLPRLAVRETSLTSRSEPGDKHNRPNHELRGQHRLCNMAISKSLLIRLKCNKNLLTNLFCTNQLFSCKYPKAQTHIFSSFKLKATL